MWSPDRRAALLGALAALGGCGFRPLHAPGGGGEALRGGVALDAGRGRHAWTFAEALRRRTGEPGPDPAFALSVELRMDTEGLAISPRDDVTRVDVLGEARFVLVERATGAELRRGVARSRSGYTTLASPFAARAARLDAERRVTEDLATRVWLDALAAVEARAS